MTFLHIILPSKRMMNTYVKMIRENFDKEKHVFLFLNRCVGEKDRELFEYDNVLEIPKSKNRLWQVWILYKILKRYDCIIWHGMIYDWKKSISIFLLQYQLKKSVWVIRGIDLYNYKLKGNGIKSRIINWVNYKIRKKIPKVVTIFPTDEDVYRKEFGDDAQCYMVFYPIGSESFDEMDKMAYGRPRSNREVWILNGNNAYTFNRHEDVLNKLVKFKNENIRIFVPLSYGNDWINDRKSYKEDVIARLKKFFKEKGCPIIKLMPIDEYNVFLSNIDVAIINSNRQNALGNILRLLYIGAKIYLAEDNPAYNYFKSEGISVFSINDIEYQDFEAFKQKAMEVTCNRKWIRNNFHPDYNFLQWGELFDTISGEKTQLKKLEKIELCTTDDNYKISKIYCKRNYLFLRKYTSNFYSLKDKELIILGANELAMSIIPNIYKGKIENSKYVFKGLLGVDDDRIDIDNYIGSYSNYLPTNKDFFICATEDFRERKLALQYIRENHASLVEYIETDITIGEHTKFGKCCVFIDQTKIGMYCQIGDNVLLQGCIVKFHVIIGNDIVIRNGSIIGSNVIIEDHVIINENVVIFDGVRISSNTIIEAGSVIKA